MGRGNGFVYLLARLAHGFAANGAGNRRIHHQLRKPARGLVERNHGVADCIQIAALHDQNQPVARHGDGRLLFCAQLVPRRILRSPRHRRENRIRLVARFDEKASRKILLGMVERIENHVFDLLIGEPIRRLHLNLRGLSTALLARGDVQNAVGVDEETHLDARQPRRHGRNAFQVEPCQRPAIGRQFALAL